MTAVCRGLGRSIHLWSYVRGGPQFGIMPRYANLPNSYTRKHEIVYPFLFLIFMLCFLFIYPGFKMRYWLSRLVTHHVGGRHPALPSLGVGGPGPGGGGEGAVAATRRQYILLLHLKQKIYTNMQTNCLWKAGKLTAIRYLHENDPKSKLQIKNSTIENSENLGIIVDKRLINIHKAE